LTRARRDRAPNPLQPLRISRPARTTRSRSARSKALRAESGTTDPLIRSTTTLARGHPALRAGRMAGAVGRGPEGAGEGAGDPEGEAAGYDGSIWTHHDGFTWLHLAATVTVRCGPVSSGTEKKGLVRGGARSSRHIAPNDQCGSTSRRPSGANPRRPNQGSVSRPRPGWFISPRGPVIGPVIGPIVSDWLARPVWYILCFISVQI
jgi:hypothetical protein